MMYGQPGMSQDDDVSGRRDAIRRLYRARPRSRFLRLSAWLAGGLVVASWLLGGFLDDPLWTPRRAANLERFLGEVVPHPSGVEFEVIDADPRRIKRLRVRTGQAG